MEGSLQDIHVGGLLRLLNLHGFSGVLHLSNGKEEGALLLKDGRLAAARRSGRTHKGDAAEDARAMLRWTKGRFRFEEGASLPGASELRDSTENLLLSALREVDPKAAAEALPPSSALLEWAPRPKGKVLDVRLEAEEWNLLLLFDGSRNLEEVLALSKLPKGRAQVMAHALLSAGLLKKVRFKLPDLERIAREAFGNMGLALVQSAYQNVGVSRARMGMRELIRILNHLEKSMELIVGPTRAHEVVERMWESVKR